MTKDCESDKHSSACRSTDGVVNVARKACFMYATFSYVVSALHLRLLPSRDLRTTSSLKLQQNNLRSAGADATAMVSE